MPIFWRYTCSTLKWTATKTRSKSGQCLVARPTRRTAKEKRNPKSGRSRRPLQPTSRKTRKISPILRFGLNHLVTVVEKRLFELLVLSGTQNTTITVQCVLIMPFQDRRSPTARSTPATGLLKLENGGPREHTRLRTLQALEKQPKVLPITARSPGKNYSKINGRNPLRSRGAGPALSRKQKRSLPGNQVLKSPEFPTI